MKKTLLLYITTLLFTTAYAQLPQLSLAQLATGYTSPVDIKNCGDNRLFIVEQAGYIRILNKNGTKQTTPFLDIDARVQSANNEQGLLGLAFSPFYKTDGFFYVNYINGTGAGSTRISRFSVMAGDSTIADPASEVILLTFTQPYSNHNGGNIMFGKDGYLYVNQGDGGNGNDPQGYAQNKNSFLGKILRLDVIGQATYAVPASNPFVGQANVKPEIWAYGLRNPWRSSFDKLTGDLWTGDVGQQYWEEIDFQDVASVGGENYGWRCREGFNVTPTANTTGCPTTGFTDPIYEVSQQSGSCSITGGYVYRGTQYGKLFGLYLFTDFCSGNFWSIKRLGSNSFDLDTLQDFTNNQFTTFGEDNLGELYVAYRGSGAGGRIYRIIETSDCKPTAFITFSDTVASCEAVQLNALKGDTLSYQWYNTNGLIIGSAGTSFTATQSGWYKVNVAKQQPSCAAMSDSVYVQIYDTASITTANTILNTCINSSINLQTFVQPSGGSFAGTGVVDSLFTPTENTILGNNTVSYSYTNLQGCDSRLDFNVLVFDTTTIAYTTGEYIVCDTVAPFELTGAVSPTGGVFTGVGINNALFNTALSGVGITNVNYTYTNINGCVSMGSFNINVVACNTVGIIESTAPFSFIVFPNPSKGSFNLSTTVSHKQTNTLRVVDILGKICFEKTILLDPAKPTQVIDLPTVAKGIYTLQLSSEKGNVSHNLIID